MIYGYARVSTAFEDTKDRNQTFDRQLMILKEHGVSEENIFCDRITGSSKTKDREAFDSLMSIVLPGDSIIVSEMSRFSRSLTDLFKSLETLIQRQIGIWFIKENIKVGTSGLDPFTRFITAILGAVNEFERNIIAERVREGMQASKMKGTQLGRPKKTDESTKQDIINAWVNGVDYKVLSQQYNLSVATLVSICHEHKQARLSNKRKNKQ